MRFPQPGGSPRHTRWQRGDVRDRARAIRVRQMHGRERYAAKVMRVPTTPLRIHKDISKLLLVLTALALLVACESDPDLMRCIDAAPDRNPLRTAVTKGGDPGGDYAKFIAYCKAGLKAA